MGVVAPGEKKLVFIQIIQKAPEVGSLQRVIFNF
jgi:hypothetical protein